MVTSPHPLSHEDDEPERKSSKYRRGKASVPQWAGSTFTTRIWILDVWQPAALGTLPLLRQDLTLMWFFTGSEPWQSKNEHGPERKGSTPHSHKITRAGSLLLRGAWESQPVMDRTPAPTVSSTTAVQLCFSWWILHQRCSCEKSFRSFLFKEPTLQLGL